MTEKYRTNEGEMIPKLEERRIESEKIISFEDDEEILEENSVGSASMYFRCSCGAGESIAKTTYDQKLKRTYNLPNKPELHGKNIVRAKKYYLKHTCRQCGKYYEL